MAGRTSPSTQQQPKLRLGEAEIVRMGLGTNRLSNTPANVAFVKEAVAAGVGMIDTAHSYTRGESEETIGAALSANPDRVLVATKGGIGGPGGGRPEILHVEIEESLRRLRSDRIALYYLHRVDPETPLEESLAAIKQDRDRGKIRHVGVSNVSIDEIERARGVGGRALAEIAARHGVTPAQIALAWLLRRSPVMLPIPGTLSLEHLKENVAALQIELTDEEFDSFGCATYSLH